MTSKTPSWYSDASETELRERAQEMRGEFSTLSETRQTDGDAFDAARSEFLSEVEMLDINLALRSKATAPAETRKAPEGLHTRQSGEDIETRSAGQQVFEDDAFKEWMSRGMRNESPSVVIRRASDLEVRDILLGSGIGADWLPPLPKYYPTPRKRKLTIRDLIKVTATTSSNHEYVRELNPATNELGASTVEEAAAKPDQTFQSEVDTAPVRVIAALSTITRQVLSDEPALRAYVDDALDYRLRVREELELLFGNGISPDLKGLTLFSGVQTQSTSGAGEYALTLGAGAAKVELVDGEASGVAMNPTTFWNMMMHRVAGGSNASGGGSFDADAFTATPVQYIWGLPIVRTRSLAANQNIVADWQRCMWLFDREQPAITVHPDHSDYAAKNKVLIRAEERVALAVPRPDLAVIVTTS